MATEFKEFLGFELPIFLPDPLLLRRGLGGLR